MKDAELIEFAREFREGILGGRPSNLMCFAVCAPLAGLLELHGVRCEVVESDLDITNHVWIRLEDGRALDPTADQFGGPDIYLGPPQKTHGA